MMNCWSLLLVAASFVAQLSPSIQLTSTHHTEIITSLELCRRKQDTFEFDPLQQVSVRINFRPDLKCPSHLKGLQCGLTFVLKDLFSSVGKRFCVDLAGVGQSIPNPQFAVNVSDDIGDIKQVYDKTRLDSPEGSVHCGSYPGQQIRVALRANPTVEMCPDILPTLVNHNTSLGTVMLKEVYPTRTVTMKDCQLDDQSYLESFSILKVIPGSQWSRGCEIKMLTQARYRQPKICLSFEFMSADFRCEGSVSLRQDGRTVFELVLPDSRESLSRYDSETQCVTLDSWADSRSSLVVSNSPWNCGGTFALGLRFTETYIHGEAEPNGNNEMRNLYMAVFIAVVSVCVLIMALVCIICIRRRARLTQRLRESHHSYPQIIQNSSAMVSSQPTFWSSTSSDQLFGLPSYEEVTSSSNPDLVESEKPPAYETLYADGGNSEETPPNNGTE